MRARLRARVPLFPRVILTAVSAFGVVLVASGFTFTQGHAAASPAYRSPEPALVNLAPRDEADARPAENKLTVQAGETLSGIAGGICGTPDDWTGFFAANRNVISDPDVIQAGWKLQISCTNPGYTPPARPPAEKAAHAVRATPAPAQARPAPVTPAAAAVTVPAGGGSFQACVIARESGGNSQVMNASGHYGLYQFSEQTWVAHGGSAADFGHASVAEQDQVFYNTVAADGHSDWSPYDGC